MVKKNGGLGMVRKIEGVKFGKCDGCGKEGVVSWTTEVEIRKGRFKRSILTCYGPFHCCNDECYRKARKRK